MEDLQGWIKLHRKVRNHWLFEEKRSFSKFEAWIDLLMDVNHKDREFLLGNELIDIKVGQTVTSIRKLCEKWGWSNSKVTQFLKLLQNEGMITYKSDTKKTIITIDKYEFYQCGVGEEATQNRRENDTKQTRKHTNKNVKNEKNEKNITTTTNPVIFYEQNIGLLSQFQMEELWNWNDDFNGQSEILIHAMKIAMDRNKKNMGFVKYLLKDWMDKGAKSLEDVQAIEIEQKGMRGVKHGKPQEDYIDKLF